MVGTQKLAFVTGSVTTGYGPNLLRAKDMGTATRDQNFGEIPSSFGPSAPNALRRAPLRIIQPISTLY
jgi:hypothetical protein